jgi:hypothetical protein
MIKLHSTIENLLSVILRSPVAELELLSSKENLTLLFKDLLQLGCDFYELLRVFVNTENVDEQLCEVILKNEVPTDYIYQVSFSKINALIPHWTGSKYHTASKKEVVCDIISKTQLAQPGCFVYNSNMNSRSSRTYNDLYILIVSRQKSYFIDVNRRKIHGLFLDIRYNEIKGVSK